MLTAASSTNFNYSSPTLFNTTREGTVVNESDSRWGLSVSSLRDTLFYKLEKTSDVIYGFNPGWFTATMGTGITGVLLYGFPYHAPPLEYIAMAIALFNVILFVLFSILLVARWMINRDMIKMLLSPQPSFVLGALPMGLCTIISSIVAMLTRYNMSWVPLLARILWAIDVVISLVICTAVPFIMFTRQKHKLSSMNPTWILPIVTTVVASSTGGVVASVHDGSEAATLVLISYAILGMGVGVAFMFITIYLLRISIYKLPPKQSITSTFIPIGPLGQSSYAIQILGVQAARIFPTELPEISHLGEVLQAFGFIAGLLLWGLSLWWLALAIYSALYTRTTTRIPFNLGWWALIFPVGTIVSSTNSLWLITGYTFFRVVTAIFVVGLTLLWVVVMALTIWNAWSGGLFVPIKLVEVSSYQDHDNDE